MGGEDIKAARVAAGLTQQGMNDKTGIPKRTIGNWETGVNQCPAWAERLIIKELEEIKTHVEAKTP